MTKKLKKTGHKYLNVLERVLTLSLLPKEGTFANLKLLRTAKENLSFTDEENKKLNFQEADGMVKWMENSVGR